VRRLQARLGVSGRQRAPHVSCACAPSAPDRRLAGWTALLTGMLVGALTMRSPLYVGPIAAALGGTDLNWMLGFLVAGGVYYALTAAPALRTKLVAIVPEP
jgi:purine-cytosine permease-like protein